MKIIRVARGNDEFIAMPRAPFQDNRITAEAKGVFGYLLTLPPDSKIRHDPLRRALGIGRDRLERIFKELIGAGYVARSEKQTRVGGGVFGGYDYVVMPADVNAAIEKKGVAISGRIAGGPGHG